MWGTGHAGKSTEMDLIIIGGGVIGLAILAEAAAAGLETVLFKRLDGFGRETSGRGAAFVMNALQSRCPGNTPNRLDQGQGW